jgi:type I protein arginine methyltransferase
MYALSEFGDMLADAARVEAYADAIHRAVRPGDIVVDLGCGPGIFAMLACRAGASRVYAIDAGDVIFFARQLAAANGLDDRIEFLHGDSRQMQLPERANVIVSDIRGALPLFAEAVPSIEDARARFLTAGGILIPQRDSVYVAILESPEYYARRASPWKDIHGGLNLTPALPLLLNASYKVRSRSEQLLTPPQIFCTLDYSRSFQPRVGAELHFRTTRPGVGHGITAWFETNLFEDVGFSTAPGSPATVYGQGFLPWLEPVPLEAGQEIEVALHADPIGGDYIWRWDTKIFAKDGHPKRTFRQSTFEGAQFASEALRRKSVDYVPVLSETGQAERWLLQAMDGTTSLQDIAQGAAERFPAVFRRQEDALRRVSVLAERLSR